MCVEVGEGFGQWPNDPVPKKLSTETQPVYIEQGFDTQFPTHINFQNLFSTTTGFNSIWDSSACGEMAAFALN